MSAIFLFTSLSRYQIPLRSRCFRAAASHSAHNLRNVCRRLFIRVPFLQHDGRPARHVARHSRRVTQRGSLQTSPCRSMQWQLRLRGGLVHTSIDLEVILTLTGAQTAVLRMLFVHPVHRDARGTLYFQESTSLAPSSRQTLPPGWLSTCPLHRLPKVDRTATCTKCDRPASLPRQSWFPQRSCTPLGYHCRRPR